MQVLTRAGAGSLQASLWQAPVRPFCVASRTSATSHPCTSSSAALQHGIRSMRPQQQPAAHAGPHRSGTLATWASRAVVLALTADDVIEVELKIEGMMCGGCTARVEEVVKKLDNVKSVAVNLETKLAKVEVRAATQMDALAMVPGLVQAVKDLGFEAEPHL